jgi:eukaryotic-like serine/threonine-protein kinase
MESVQANQIFGAYRLERKLGKGGMATVFKAVHIESGEDVAVKILHDQFADDGHIRKRLEHEASIAARLIHPNIVPVWDFGEHKHRPYLVMPYMEGGSFAEYFATPRSVKHELSLRVLTLLANALDYAHSNGVVHRDIKLENILLGKNNIPAISDFGIAQSTQTTRITMTGQILGTPQYLAPENFSGAEQADHRADLYAFGVAAYLMLTGYFPFTGKDPLSIVLKHREQAVPLANLVNPKLPKALNAIFDKALAKDPNERYASALDFVESLEAAFFNVPSVSSTIYLNSVNPVSSISNEILRAQANETSGIATRVLELHEPAIPAVTETIAEPKSRKAWPFMLAGLLIACAGLSLFAAALNNFFVPDNEPGGVSLTQDLLLGLPNVEETASATATSTETSTATLTATATATPSITSTQTATSTGTITSTYTYTPSPTSTATRRFRPTASPNPTATSSSTIAVNNPPATNRPPSRTPRPTSTFTPVPTNTPRPTSTFTPIPSDTEVPTLVPTDTSVPPSDVPPTDVPATDEPPTDAPATEAAAVEETEGNKVMGNSE